MKLEYLVNLRLIHVVLQKQNETDFNKNKKDSCWSVDQVSTMNSIMSVCHYSGPFTEHMHLTLQVTN